MDKTLKPPNGAGAACVMPDGTRQVIKLSRNQTLVITRAHQQPAPAAEQPGEDCLQLVDAHGTASLTIRLSPAGPVIEVGGGSMALKVDGDLAIAARRLLLHGSEGVAISSDADVRITARENLATQAKRQDVTATRGDVRVYANDDIKMDGERIRLNC